jgi:hypothetical protein
MLQCTECAPAGHHTNMKMLVVCQRERTQPATTPKYKMEKKPAVMQQ